MIKNWKRALKRKIRNAVKRQVVRHKKVRKGQAIPTQKTTDHFKSYITKKTGAASEGLIERIIKATTEADGSRESIRKMSRSFEEVSRAQSVIKIKLLNRINARQALNALRVWNPEKRRTILKIVETWLDQLNYFSGTGQSIPGVFIQRNEEDLVRVLGEKKAGEFVLLLTSKNRAWRTTVEQQ